MIKDKKWIFSMLFRIAALLGVLGVFCLLICEIGTAEFTISLAVVVLNAAMAVVAAVVIRRDNTK